mgnify:CR=1 FL=1
MKNIKISFVYLLILVGITSCEEVIELDLATTEPKVVIEGIITDQPGPYTVTIKKTADFYDRNNFPAGTGATIIITDDVGNVDFLKEVEDGVYQTHVWEGVAGRTYNLTVE